MSLSKLPISDRALDELYALFSPLATAEALKNAFPHASKREAALILKKPARKPEAPKAAPDSVRVPLKEVFENKKLFQNRQTDYSTESRDRIIAAVEEGKFRWSIFDPITLWRNPEDGKLYILSGHSRTAAFRELAKSRPEFATIPARIEENATLEQAIEIARNSNTLSTKETDVERALYYASLRPATPEREIMQLIERQEGANASRIKKFSFLNPRGKALQNAQAFQGSGATNRNAANELAEWVGEARRRYPQLTNAHENELTEWLLSGAKNTLRTQTDFLTKVEQAVQKNTEFGTFYPERILNMSKAVQRNTGEKEWEAIRRDLEKQANEAKKTLEDKRLRHTEVLTEEVRKGTATPERLNKLKEVLTPYEEAYTAAQLRLIAHNNQKDTFRQEGKKQAALFGLRDSEKEKARELKKAVAALNKVINEKTDVFDAFYAPRVGSISLLWGKEGDSSKEYAGGSGVSHIIAKRNSEGEQGIKEARRVIKTVIYGKVVKRNLSNGRIFIQYKGYEAILSIFLNNQSVTWLLTGYKIYEEKQR